MAFGWWSLPWSMSWDAEVELEIPGAGLNSPDQFSPGNEKHDKNQPQVVRPGEISRSRGPGNAAGDALADRPGSGACAPRCWSGDDSGAVPRRRCCSYSAWEGGSGSCFPVEDTC